MQAGNEWSQLRTDLESKLAGALSLNNNLQSEIEKAKSHHLEKEQGLRSQIDEMIKQESGENEWRSRYEELQHYHQELQSDLQGQRQVTNEVRQEASSFLEEMKAISEQSTQNYERQEKLVQQVHRLEDEIKEWKSRYARVKTQLRTMRTNSMGLAIQQPDTRQHTKSGAYTHADGLIKEIHMTKFQLGMDEVLRIARIDDDAAAVLDSMKQVIATIRLISQDVSDGPSTSDPHVSDQRLRLRTKLAATANNFITAARNFAHANGLSPVSLLDAAASHLASAVIDLVKAVGMRPTPVEELGTDDEDVEDEERVTARAYSPDYFSLPTTTHSSTSTNPDSIFTPASTIATTAVAVAVAPRGSSIPPPQPSSRLSATDAKSRPSRRSVSANAVPTGRALDSVRLPMYSGLSRNPDLDDLKVS